MPIMTRSRNMFVCNEDSAKRHAKCHDAARAIYNTGMTSPKTSELRPAVAAAAATCDTARCVQASADIGGSWWRRPSSRSSRVPDQMLQKYSGGRVLSRTEGGSGVHFVDGGCKGGGEFEGEEGPCERHHN